MTKAKSAHVEKLTEADLSGLREDLMKSRSRLLAGRRSHQQLPGRARLRRIHAGCAQSGVPDGVY